jgi:hypothetical protein
MNRAVGNVTTRDRRMPYADAVRHSSRGATATILRISAWIRPARSPRPTPIIATRMTPTGPKLMEFGTAEVQIKRIPSSACKLLTAVVTSSGSCVWGLILW